MVNKDCLKLYPSTSYLFTTKGNNNFRMEKHGKYYLNVIKVNTTIIHMDIMCPDIMHQEGHMIFAVFLPKYNFNLVVRQY